MLLPLPYHQHICIKKSCIEHKSIYKYYKCNENAGIKLASVQGFQSLKHRETLCIVLSLTLVPIVPDFLLTKDNRWNGVALFFFFAKILQKEKNNWLYFAAFSKFFPWSLASSLKLMSLKVDWYNVVLLFQHYLLD